MMFMDRDLYKRIIFTCILVFIGIYPLFIAIHSENPKFYFLIPAIIAYLFGVVLTRIPYKFIKDSNNKILAVRIIGYIIILLCCFFLGIIYNWDIFWFFPRWS